MYFFQRKPKVNHFRGRNLKVLLIVLINTYEMLKEPQGVFFNSWVGKEENRGILQRKRELLNLFQMTANTSTS